MEGEKGEVTLRLYPLPRRRSSITNLIWKDKNSANDKVQNEHVAILK